MNTIKITEKDKRNISLCRIIKCVIRRPDGSEVWIKREGEDITDYEVFDRIISGNYVFEEVYTVDQ